MVVKSFKCSKSINGKLVRDENAFVAVFYQLWVIGVGLGEEGGQSLVFFPEKKKTCEDSKITVEVSFVLSSEAKHKKDCAITSALFLGLFSC